MLQKKLFSPRLFKILFAVAAIVVCSSAAYFFIPRGLTAAPDHITLTWTADARTTQTISWRTAATMKGGQVQYAAVSKGKVLPNFSATADARVQSVATNGGEMSIHSATLTTLQPNTRYIYRVGDGTRWSAINNFTTSAERVPQFKFLVFGDSQSYKYNVWQATLHKAYEANHDAVFMTNIGDLVDVGLDYEQWNGWFDAGLGVIDTIPVMPVSGNHENYTPEQGMSMPILFKGQFRLPANGPEELKGQVYSFDYGDVHFSVLDSQQEEEQDFVPTMLAVQKQWLEQDLQGTDKRWKIVLMHRPPYHNRPNAGDEHLREAFVPIIDKYHVDIVFAGHDHAYARSYPMRGGVVVPSSLTGTIYVTTGRSGTKTYDKALAKNWDAFFYNPQDAPNYLTVEVTENSVAVQVFKQNGILIEAWTINK